MGPSAPTPAGFITATQAAEELGVKPWDVMRLIQSGELQSVVLVEIASLKALKEKS